MINSFENLKALEIDKAQLLNVLEFIDDTMLITLNGDIQYSFELFLPEIYSLSGSDFKKCSELWERLLKMLPEGYVLHKQDTFFKENFSDTKVFREREKDDVLSKSSYSHFANRQYLNHRSFLFITRLRDNLNKTQSVFCRSHSVIRDNLFNDKLITSFKEVILDIKAVLDGGPLKYIDMDKNLYYDLHQKYLNLDFDREDPSKELFQHNGNCYIAGDIVDVFCLKKASQLPEHLYYCSKESSLCSEESTILKSFLAPIGIQLPIDHVVNQYIYIANKEKSIYELNRKRKQAKALSSLSRESALLAEDLQEYLSSITSEEANPIRYHLNCIFKSDKNDRDMNRQLARKAFNEIGIDRVESSIPALLFFFSAPCSVASLPKEKTFFVTPKQGVALLVNDTSGISKPSKFAIRMTDRLQGRPVWVDLHHEPFNKGCIHNRNKFVLGPSGSGKSFFMNHLTKSFYEDGGHVLIIDMGGSYLNNCEVIKEEAHGNDGLYFEYTEDEPLSFNPFFLSAIKENYDLDHRELIKAILIGLWKKDDEIVSKYEEAILKKVIERYGKSIARDKETKASFSDFYKFIYDNYLDCEEIKLDKAKFDIEDFLVVTKEFVRGGKYGFLLNAEENIDLLKKKFVVFELDTIRNNKDILPIVTLMIMYLFEAKIRKIKGAPKMMVIEEAWSALLRTEMANYILYIVKTVRRFDGQTVFVTQDLKDLTKSDIVKDAIISNSDCKILLDQRKFEKNFDIVKQTLGLSESDTNQILSINRNITSADRKYKEVWIGLGVDSSQVYALEVSPHEYYTYTSHKTDKEYLEGKKQEYNSVISAINIGVKEKNNIEKEAL